MNITKIGMVTLLAACFACASQAEARPDAQSTIERQSSATEKSAEAYDLAVSAAPKVSGRADTTSGTYEVFKNVVISAGKSTSLDSTLDYSTASAAAVTVLCGVCSSDTTSLGSSGLVLQARWRIPSADSYVTVEKKLATTFPYWDAGGALFSVYGSQFRLTLQNTGTTSITIQQLTVFRRN